MELDSELPLVQSYITRHQDQRASQAGERGFSDLHTYQYRGHATSTNKLLIVQCKKAELETQSSVWADGVDQLDRYLSATHGSRRPQDRTPVYGTVAIGKHMRVYRYDDINQCVLNWAPRSIQLGYIWHLEDDDTTIQLFWTTFLITIEHLFSHQQC